MEILGTVLLDQVSASLLRRVINHQNEQNKEIVYEKLSMALPQVQAELAQFDSLNP